MPSKLSLYPEYPPRVRLEWLIASSRVVLAGGALIAVAMNPQAPSYNWAITNALAWYLFYSVMVLALVWTPVRFARGWDVALHAFDLAAFSFFMLFTEGANGPFFVYFVFVMICGTLRWEVRGAIWTAAVTMAIYAGVTEYAVRVLHIQTVRIDTFVIRIVYLIVFAALLGYLGAYQHRFQREINRVVSWPRKLPDAPNDLAAEVVAHAVEVLEAPRALLLWEDPLEGHINLAWGTERETEFASEPEGTYGSFVIHGLEHKSFQAADANDQKGRVVQWANGSFRVRHCGPVNPALRARFSIRGVQSWSLDGELVRGRLFVLDKPRMRIDGLIFGEVVARLAVSRLDSVYLFRRLNQAVALEERLRVARDLHDSLLQSVSGAALQLLSARRMLDRDPDAARRRLEDVQNQLEVGELDMRSFIRRLRPSAGDEGRSPKVGLNERLEELRRRVDRQWEVKVKMHLDPAAAQWPDVLVDDVYRIVQEGVLNAARHADASVISVDLSGVDGLLRLRIADDGRGFPFQGTYDLRTLTEMNRGPLTLKERVAELHGDLTLQTADTGSELLITLPLTPVAS